MADNDIKIKISLDGGQTYVQALAQVEKATDKFTKKTSDGSYALSNLGRVVSDAPFGFIAIGNNIEQLAVSMTMLKAETGSLSLAFKSMWASLMGPTGILLAIQAVISAFTFYSLGTRGAKEETDVLTDSVDKLKSSLSDMTRQQMMNQKAVAEIAMTQGQGKITEATSKRDVFRKDTWSWLEADKELKNIQKQWQPIIDQNKEVVALLETELKSYGAIAQIQEKIKGLEAERGNIMDKNSPLYKDYNNQIKEQQDILDNLLGKETNRVKKVKEIADSYDKINDKIKMALINDRYIQNMLDVEAELNQKWWDEEGLTQFLEERRKWREEFRRPTDNFKLEENTKPTEWMLGGADRQKELEDTFARIAGSWGNILQNEMMTAWDRIFGHVDKLWMRLLKAMASELMSSIIMKIVGLYSGGFMTILKDIGGDRPVRNNIQPKYEIILDGRILGEFVEVTTGRRVVNRQRSLVL